MNEKENVNIFSSHTIVKDYYYEEFMMFKPEVEINVNEIYFLIGPGGVGKTYSSLVAKSTISLFNKKLELIELKGLKSIKDIIESDHDFDVIIFDALNESLDEEGIFNEIKELIDNKTLLIINSRRSDNLDIDENNIYNIDYFQSYVSFCNENRLIDDYEKNEIWKVIKSFYYPRKRINSNFEDFFIVENENSNNESNLRTLRLLHDSLQNNKIQDRNDDSVIQIRHIYEQFIKRELLKSRNAWDEFKENIYDFKSNAIQSDQISNVNKKILIEHDIFRLNEGTYELRDFNIIDHIISLKIINELVTKESLTDLGVKEIISKITNQVDNIEGYNGSNEVLKSMVIYQFLHRLVSWGMEVHSRIIEELLRTNKDVAIKLMRNMSLSKENF